MQVRSTFAALATFALTWSSAFAADRPKSHTVRELEGWKIQVDDRLLSGAEVSLGEKALRTLGFKLHEIRLIVPADRVAKLQQVPIWMGLVYPGLGSMQYHPSADWLKSHGHDPKMAKAVHLPNAAEVASRFLHDQQPMAILHELAHAYHDRELGFDEPRIAGAWARVKSSGRFDKVLHLSGREIRHYALTDCKEFFAEMTESFFGTNDFHPFVRAELKKDFPEVEALMQDIWMKPLQKPAEKRSKTE